MAGMLRVPMRRGDLTGVLLVLLGAWGALIAFIGSYFITPLRRIGPGATPPGGCGWRSFPAPVHWQAA